MLGNGVANNLVNYLGGRVQNISGINNVYVGLSSTAPTATGGNITEPTGNGYSRALLGSYSQSLTQLMGAAANGVAQNAKTVKFDEATGDWGTLTHMVLYSAENGGTFLAFAPLTAPITPTAGKIPIIRVGNLTISAQ